MEPPPPPSPNAKGLGGRTPVQHHTRPINKDGRPTTSPTTPLPNRVPVSQFPGVTEGLNKKFRKHFERTENKVQLTESILAKSGVDLDRPTVVGLIANILDDQPEVRSYSKLMRVDLKNMCANIFIDVAVYLARTIFNEPRLIVAQELQTEEADVPEIGSVSGPLDHVTGRAAGEMDMGISRIF